MSDIVTCNNDVGCRYADRRDADMLDFLDAALRDLGDGEDA